MSLFPSRQHDSRNLGGGFPNHIENGDLVVPADHYFMMGDNRHNSADSRYWVLCPGKTFWGGRFSTTGLQGHGGCVGKDGLGSNLPGWAMWRCTFFGDALAATLHPIR